MLQAPQFITSLPLMHWPAHRRGQLQTPATQEKPAPMAVTHSWSVVGWSSTMPLQSSSLPSHDSLAGEHWQMFEGCPMSALQLQPATHWASAWHGVVHAFFPLPSG